MIGPTKFAARILLIFRCGVVFCVAALKEALAKHGTPDIFNTEQGSQFTSGDWINVLTDSRIKISMDGDECVCLHAFETGLEMRVGIRKWLAC
ncbi:hypothetical protein OAO50_05960 [Paracoccaceae bacterium]|nr:hypothetical protein [Paracoccaceae bacterium]